MNDVFYNPRKLMRYLVYPLLILGIFYTTSTGTHPAYDMVTNSIIVLGIIVIIFLIITLIREGDISTEFKIQWISFITVFLITLSIFLFNFSNSKPTTLTFKKGEFTLLKSENGNESIKIKISDKDVIVGSRHLPSQIRSYNKLKQDYTLTATFTYDYIGRRNSVDFYLSVVE